MTREHKDPWDKVSLALQGILVPLAIALLSYSVSKQSSAAELDVDLMIKFRDVYYADTIHADAESRRRLSPYLINRMSSPCVREQLRRFVVWDILERNISPYSDAQVQFRF